jgi:hypothetical protein
MDVGSNAGLNDPTRPARNRLSQLAQSLATRTSLTTILTTTCMCAVLEGYVTPGAGAG